MVPLAFTQSVLSSLPRAVVPTTHPLARGIVWYAPTPHASETPPRLPTLNEYRKAFAPAWTGTGESSGTPPPPSKAPSPPATLPQPRVPLPTAPATAQTRI